VPEMRTLTSEDLRDDERAVLHDLFQAAWHGKGGHFDPEDEEHAYGGVHFLVEEDGQILAHASVVARELHTGDHALNTGYVEAVATWPAYQRRGYASALMRAVGEHLDDRYDLGGLSIGVEGFYERFGWRYWEGPTYCRTPDGLVRTADEDGVVMVRSTPRTPEIDITAPISCNLRSGDVW
jgi:aminoglycoside 2'-N-acetyltransferase I